MKDGYKETKIGWLPEMWEPVALNELVEVMKSGLSRLLSHEDIGLPVIRSTNIQKGLIDFTKLKYWYETDPKGANTSKYILQEGDILVNFINSTAQIGKSCIYREKINRPAIYTTNLLLLRFNSRIIPQYFHYFTLSNTYKWFISTITKPAVNQASFTTKDFKKMLVPIPHKDEQHKIAEILSTVDETIEKTDALIEETRQLKKGLMQSFFLNKAYMIKSKAKEENTNLKVVYLRDLGKIVTGTTPSTKVEEYYDSNDYMFIGPADLGNNKRIISSIKYISNDGFEVSRKLPKDSVMVVCIGATIGKVGITNEPSSTNQQVNTIIPSVNYFNDYIYYLLSGISEYLRAFAGDTATPQLNKTDFGKVITFVHIDFGEQEKIAQILSEVDNKIEKEEATKAKLEQLKKGLMQVLLTGKVRVKA